MTKEGKSSPFDKKTFLELLHKSYIDKHINTNLICHITFFKTFKEMCNDKHESVLLQKYEKIKHMLLDNDYEHVPDIPDDDHTSVSDLVMQFSRTWPVLESLQEVLTQDAYALLNVLYGHIVNHTRYDDALACVIHLLRMKPKDFSKQTDVSALVVIFNVMLHISKTLDAKHMYKYMVVSRELIFWKGTKKAMMERTQSKLMKTCIYVLVSRNLDQSVPRIVTGPICKQKYLFVVCERDWTTSHQLDEVKHAIPRHTEVKNVKVPLPQVAAANRVDIIKKYINT